MTNLEKLKSRIGDPFEVAKFICNLMEVGGEDCSERCPLAQECGINNNAIEKWLKEENNERDLW